MTPKETIRLAAVADIHCSKSSHGKLEPLFTRAAAVADILILSGDLTDYGLPEEAKILARELGSAKKIPMLGVLGNHDHESGKASEVSDILCEAGVVVLDGHTCEFHGIGFAGAKGFGGGFGKRMLSPWGEQTMKAFVHEAVEEALKLESALAKLRTPQKIAVLHYSPIEATVIGEHREIFPFLGNSRLEDALGRHPVGMVFHGHAHHGSMEGRTNKNVPVYNVAMPLLARVRPEEPPFRLIEVRVEPAAVSPALAASASS